MDIAELSMVMSQSRVQESAGIQLTKMTMNSEKEAATQITEMIGSIATDPNLGKHLDVSV